MSSIAFTAPSSALLLAVVELQVQFVAPSFLEGTEGSPSYPFKVADPARYERILPRATPRGDVDT